MNAYKGMQQVQGKTNELKLLSSDEDLIVDWEIFKKQAFLEWLLYVSVYS